LSFSGGVGTSPTRGGAWLTGPDKPGTADPLAKAAKLNGHENQKMTK